jgi:hypothetical protein
MNMSHIVLFAIVGAVIATVVAGGLAGMMDMDAGAGALGGAAVLGASGAGAVAYVMGGAAADVVPAAIMTAIGGAPDMKVGLPNF